MKRILALLFSLVAGAAMAAPPIIPPPAPTKLASPSVAQSVPIIYLPGDSLTRGSQDLKSGSIGYYLSRNYGFMTIDDGLDGQTSTQICARAGLCALTITFASNQIVSGSNSVTAFNGNAISGMNTATPAVQPISTTGENTTTYMAGSTCGVHGTLTRTATGGPPSTSETYTFTPDSISSTSACAANSTFTPDAGTYSGNTVIIWWGRNNYTSPMQVQTDIATAVSTLTTSNYLILGIINAELSTEYSGQTNYNTIVTLNNALASTYGSHFLDVRSYLVGLYNSGNALDVFDHTNGIPPSSLRSIDATGTVPALTNSQTSFTTNSITFGAGANNTVIAVDSEYIFCTTFSGTSVSGCTRGYAGSTAATHSSGATFSDIDSLHLSSAGYQIVANYIMAHASAWMPSENSAISLATSGQYGTLTVRDQPCSQFINTYGTAPFPGGSCNLFVGVGAGLLMPSPNPTVAGWNGNLFIGDWAGSTATSTNESTYVGEWSGTSTVGASGSGSANACLGFKSCKSITSGSNDTGIGAYALWSANSVSNSTCVGTLCLTNATGSFNTAFGEYAGHTITFGTNNLIIGPQVASTTLTSGSSNIVIGTSSAADTVTATTNNEVYVGGKIEYNVITGISVTSGAGTSPTIAGLGTDLFQITYGSTGTPSTALVLVLPAAANDWLCTATNQTAGTIGAQTASSTTSVTLTFGSAPANSAVVKVSCVGR